MTDNIYRFSDLPVTPIFSENHYFIRGTRANVVKYGGNSRESDYNRYCFVYETRFRKSYVMQNFYQLVKLKEIGVPENTIYELAFRFNTLRKSLAQWDSLISIADAYINSRRAMAEPEVKEYSKEPGSILSFLWIQVLEKIQ